MFLTDLPRILTWEHYSSELSKLHSRFVGLLADRLGQLLSRLAMAGHARRADEIKALVDVIDELELVATLTAPEVSYRLLWQQHHVDVDAAEFILTALRATQAATTGGPVALRTWLASGNAFIDETGSVTAPWGGAGGLPVDCGSPYALSTDVSGERVRIPEPHSPIEPGDLRRALANLDIALADTAQSVPHAWRMVQDFTKALILLPDHAAPNIFSSGSSGQFVGRSVLANPHLDKVTTVHLAEAVVHEAIHSVLYMDEQHDPWVLDTDLYAGPMRIASPWTGNLLPLRPFLQAHFVWYGLLAFWSQALATGAFPQELVRERLNAAAVGFLRGDLRVHIGPVATRLSAEVLDAVVDLQRRVVAVFNTSTDRAVVAT